MLECMRRIQYKFKLKMNNVDVGKLETVQKKEND